MTLPSNGIPAGVIREIMPPYHLSADLVAATFAALAPPPHDALPAWRHARVTRLIREITTLLPADAAQTRLASQILIVRELADTVSTRAYAPDVSVEQMCRLSRTSAELVRTAALLVRALERCQQTPVPFYGTVVEDEVDIAAVDAAWCNDDIHREAAPNVTPASAGAAAPAGAIEPEPMAGQPNTAPFAANAEPSPTATPVPGATAVRSQPDRSAGAAACLGREAVTTSASVVTRLDRGRGWTLDVVRPRTGGEAGGGAAPEAGA
jgi:hypothetical protein